MTEKTAKAILEELTALRLEVQIQTQAARETEATLLAIAEKYDSKQTACQWLRKEGVELWPVN